MDEKVAFVIRGLQARFPDAGITETLAAANSVLTQPSLGSSGAPPSLPSSWNGAGGRGTAAAAVDKESAWRADAIAIMDVATKMQDPPGPTRCGSPRLSLAQRLEAAAHEWQLLSHNGTGSAVSSQGNSIVVGGVGGGAVAAMTSGGANNLSFDGTPSIVSVDATPEDLPVGSLEPRSASDYDNTGGGGPVASRHQHPAFGQHSATLSHEAAALRVTVPPFFPTHPREAPLASTAPTAPATPCPESDADSDGTDDEQAMAHAKESNRLAEMLCRGVYEDLYRQFVIATKDDASGDDDADTDEEEELPVPLCSLVIECDGAGSASEADRGDEDGNVGRVYSFVVGCSWAQWEYLRRGPLACQCPPYPQRAAPWAEKLRWRQRHCQVRFLHPVSDFFQQRRFGAPASCASSGDADGGNSGTAVASSTNNGSGRRHNGNNTGDTASDITTTNVEYDLSEGHVVLRSLLGLAMRVWCEADAHLVAQVDDLEAPQPSRTYHSDVFWSNFPQNVPPRVRRGDRASLRGCHLPTPLLPGEYLDGDMDEDDDNNNDDGEEQQ